MDHFFQLNLIHLFDFYLAAMLVIGLYRRRGIYWDAICLLASTIGRRKKLLDVVGDHKKELLRANVLRPVLVALALMMIQWICSRILFPQATITLAEIGTRWWRIAILILAFVPMFAIDLYFVISVGGFDHGETAKYLDQAENWLGWRGPLVRIATLGIVNPKKIVHSEVRKSLRELGDTVSWSMWWMSLQVLLRVAFGLVIWIEWALRD